MNSRITSTVNLNESPKESVSSMVLSPVADDVMNGFEKITIIPREARNFYKLVTADVSQICDGRIVPTVADTSQKGPLGSQKISQGNADFTPDKSLTSTPQPQHTSKSSSTKVTFRKKFKPQHRDPQMNENLKGIIRTSRFCFVPKECVHENSAFKKVRAKTKLRKPLPSKNPFDESEYRKLDFGRVSRDWVPGVEFSRDMEVFFFNQ